MLLPPTCPDWRRCAARERGGALLPGQAVERGCRVVHAAADGILLAEEDEGGAVRREAGRKGAPQGGRREADRRQRMFRLLGSGGCGWLRPGHCSQAARTVEAVDHPQALGEVGAGQLALVHPGHKQDRVACAREPQQARVSQQARMK